MDGLNDLISSLSQDDINSLKNIAASLMGGGSQQQTQQQASDGQQSAPQSAPAGGMPDLSALFGGTGGAPNLSALLGGAGGTGGTGGAPNLSSLFGDGGLGIDPAMIGKIMGLMKKMNNADDDRVRFITALKPVLSEPRRKKADEAMKMMRLMEMIPLLREQGIF